MTDSATSLPPPANDAVSPNVRQRLVEVAARHFAEHGIQGASQRAIQREVGVNNSTANYHFGSKEALYRAVVEEALSRIQSYRLAGLQTIPDGLSREEHVRALLKVYLHAHIREAGTEAGYNFVRIVASLNLIVPDAAAQVLDERIVPVRELYVDVLAKLFPDASRNRIYSVLRLVVGLMATAPIQPGRTHVSKERIDRITEDVVTIATIAFDTLCSQPQANID